MKQINSWHEKNGGMAWLITSIIALTSVVGLYYFNLNTPVKPAPSTPAPSSPAPSSPAPSTPAPSTPVPSIPAPSIPAPSIPAPSIPVPSIPAPSIPAPSIPVPSTPDVLSVGEGQFFELCGYKNFTVKAVKQFDRKLLLKIRSMDRSIPNSPFRGYEKIAFTNKEVKLWSNCSVVFQYENVLGTKRIYISELRTNNEND